MPAAYENALTILRAMSEAGLGVRETKSRQELIDLSGLDETEATLCDNYLIRAGYLSVYMGEEGGLRELTAAGISHLQRALAERLPLTLDAERLLRHMVDSNQMGQFGRERLIAALGLSASRYATACRRLHGYGLIHPLLHFAEKEWGVISPTQKGCQAVYDDFKKPDTPTTHITYDQRGQQVTYQYNAAGDINFDAVQNRRELVTELEKLRADLSKAVEDPNIDADVAHDAENAVRKAITQAKRPDADKKTILDRLNEAKALLTGVGAAATAIEALAKAAELVQKLF